MQLKVDVLGIESGGKPIVFMNKSDADEIGVTASGRVILNSDGKERTTIVNTSTTVDVARAIIKDKKLLLSASVLVDGQYGLSDLCLGVPVKISKKGIGKIEEIDLTKSELESLRHSASVVKNYLATSVI